MNKKNWILALLFCLSASIAADTTFAQSTAPSQQPDADNTALNKRDAEGRTLTPADQASGSKADVELTRKIRRLITDDKSLSTKARNAKIITINGQTTLRGPVDSAAEKARLEKLAGDVVGSAAVRNELEIKMRE